MKQYCYLVDNKVQEIIPEFIDIFPNIPIKERYSVDFLKSCIEVDENVQVETSWVYENGAFKAPVAEPQIIEEPVDHEKVQMAETIIELNAQLEALQGGKS
jgi:hypothetical protein